MAAEDPVKLTPVTTCCAVWKEKCSKLEAGRKHLRQAVQILEEQIDKVQTENTNLKKAYDEEWARAVTEKAGKENEIALRISYEDEIASLRSEIYSLKQNGSSDTEDKKGEVELLKDHLSEAEKEISQLKALLEKEKTRADSEKKNAETQKISASEAWKQVESEKGKANEEKKLANVERKKAENFRVQLEKLRKEAEAAKLKLASEISKSEDIGKKLEAEKINVDKERKRADLAVVKADKQRKLAEEKEKSITLERSHAENLLKQLEDARKEIEELKEKNSLISSKSSTQLPVVQNNQGGVSILKSDVPSLQQTNSASDIDKTREKEINLLKELLDQERKRSDAVKKSAAEARKHLKAEKAKVDKEKKNADMERKKVEEYQIQIEALRKEANETETKLLSEISQFEEANKKLKMEKSQLSNKLEESRHKIVELQKQVNEHLSRASVTETPTVLLGKDVNSKTSKLKLVQEKLKLEKMRLKCVKQMAKLETDRSSTLRQELGLIKLDSVKIFQRLDALDKWLMSGTQLREGLEKVPSSANMQRSTLKRKLCDLEPNQMYPLNESELCGPRSGALTSFGSLGQNLYCTDELLPICEGNHTEAISGIHSKLKPLLGGPCKNLVKSSAASFSDSQLVGSQVKGAVVSASDKRVEENCDAQTSSGISGEVNKMQCHENLATVEENIVRNPSGVDAFGRVNGHGIRLMGMCDTIESVKYLYSEGKKLHTQMEEKLSILHGVLNKELEKPGEESKILEVGVQCGSFAIHEKCHKKRKVHQDERTVMEDLSSRDEQEKMIHIGNANSEDATASRHDFPSEIELLGNPQECLKGLSDSLGSDLEPVANVGEVDVGDYMKLLDLDSREDEDCYRRALEMPLSPTLPEVEIPSAETLSMDKSQKGDSLDNGLPNDIEILVPVVNIVDNSSNNRRYGTEAPGFAGERASNRQLKHTKVVQSSTTSRSGDGVLVSSNISHKSKLESEHASILTYCVVSSDVMDCGSISRIFTFTRNCLLTCSLEAEKGCFVRKILHSIKMERNLLLKEKACALFTLLLLNFSACCTGNFGSHWDDHHISSLHSFAAQVNSVMSDIEARSLFMDLCCVDGLLGLFEDFLLNGQLVVCTDVSSGVSSECDSRMNIFLDGANISLSCKPASDDLLFGGSVILALICAEIDRIEFVHEVSYKLLRSRKYDSNALLTILHIFANFSGKKFCSSKERSLTITALKSVVTYLETKVASAASTCHIYLHGTKVMFHPCAECPFGEVSVDTALLMLSEKLHSYAHATFHQLEVNGSLNSRDVYCKDNAKDHASENRNSCGLDMNCDASCALNASVVPTADSGSFCGGTLCEFSDVLSLVELLACYMSWEWICCKMIPVLLELLEKLVEDHFIIALVILLGQLGRLGVAECGYEDKEVEKLRHKLSNFLWLDKTMNARPLSVQIATVASLLQLLSLDVENVMKSDLKLQDATSQSVVDQIGKWFSLLSQEQKTLALGVLKSSGEEPMVRF